MILLHLVLGFDHWIFHPLIGRGYQFWSGIAGCFVSLGFLTGLVAWYRHHNCHVHKCWRLSWHNDPDRGHPVCKRHHPEHPKGGGTTIV